MPQSSAELAKQFGGSPSSALAAQFGGKPATLVPSPVKTDDAAPRTWLDDVKDFAVGVWQKQPIHPIDIAKGTIDAANHPIETVKGIVTSQGVPLSRAEAAFKRGDYAAGVTDVINWLLPVIGPQISESQDRLRKGEVSPAGFMGESVGIATQVALPEAARRAPAMRVPAAMTNRNPAEQAAVAFGESRGIPIDAATATGNSAVKGMQSIVDRGIGGSVVAGRAKAAQEGALTRVSGELADAAHPAAISPYQAGEAVAQGVDASVSSYAKAANTAYEALRKIEADPKNTQQVRIKVQMTDSAGKVTTETQTVPMQLPVDLRAAKAQLRPIYDRMMRQMPVAQQRADPALHAIKNVLDAPDYLPASMVDMDLSAIKALARTEGPRDISQGLAAQAVKNLDASVRAAVAKGGQAATDALAEGRAATTGKYRAADLAKQLRDEPVQVFDQATWANDAGIDRLQAIAREAPGTLPKVGRAWLDQAFAKATSEGGFGKTGTLQASWERMGPKTKALIFKNPQLVKDLDNFFLLAKRMADNPNPSGSAHIAGLGAQGALLVTEPVTGVTLTLTSAALSKLMHSPAGVRALSRGFSVPVASKGQAASTWAMLQSAAKAEGVPLVPVTAESEGTPTARGAQ